MKKVLYNGRYVPRYENGSSFSEIARFLKSQMASQKPQEYPKGMAAGQTALQFGALGSQLMGIAGQTSLVKPPIANPSDVNAAFEKVPVGTTMNYLDNFFNGQTQALARHYSSQGASAYDVANLIAKPMAENSRVRSSTAIDLINSNKALDRSRAAFNIEQDARITEAENMTAANENQKLAALGGKTAEGAAALGNLQNQIYTGKQQVDLINNSKMAQLMNQLMTANFYDQMYKKPSSTTAQPATTQTEELKKRQAVDDMKMKLQLFFQKK